MLLGSVVQETDRRGLLLHWASTCLSEVGLHANRRRVFFVALHERLRGKFDNTTLRPLSSFVQRMWNERNQVPMEAWLLKADERASDDDKRLRLMGNIVVPNQGMLAAELLLRMQRQYEGSLLPDPFIDDDGNLRAEA